jgi:hypothetical protein
MAKIVKKGGSAPAASASTEEAKAAKAAKTPKAPKEPKAPKAPKEPKAPRDTNTGKVREIIVAAGAEGITAAAIAEQMGLITGETSSEDRTAALKKVRIMARKVTGGSSTQQEGKSAVYVMTSAE